MKEMVLLGSTLEFFHVCCLMKGNIKNVKLYTEMFWLREGN